MPKKSRRPKIAARRLWTLNPATRVVPDKRRRPHRKLKHKEKLYGEDR